MKRTFSLIAMLGFIALTMLNTRDVTAKATAEPFCSVTCGTVVNGIYYEVKAGSIFTSCETAAGNCASKLGRVVASIQ